MRKLRLSLILAAVCTMLSSSAISLAAPVLEYGTEPAAETETRYDGNAQAVKNTTDILSETLKGNGTKENPFRISSVSDLLYLSKQVEEGNTDYASAYYLQIADIDLTGTDYTPIGTKSNPFTGLYDGGKCRITWQNAVFEGDAFGIFGFARGADFYNIDVEMNADVTFKENTENSIYAGFLCGYYSVAEGTLSTVSGCRMIGALTVKSDFRTINAGGMFGTFQAKQVVYSDVLLSDCECAVDVKASAKTSPYIGGLAGRVDTAGRARVGFERCVVGGSVYADGYSTEAYTAYAGGLVGCLYVDDGDWSMWSSEASLMEADRITITAKDCIVMPTALVASLMGDPGKSTAWVDWLCAGTSEAVTTQNCYYLKNDAVHPNANAPKLTEVESKKQLFSYELLSSLSLDMDCMWTWSEGESVSLRAEEKRVIARQYGETLVVAPLGGQTGTIVVAYRTPTGKTFRFEVKNSLSADEIFVFQVPKVNGIPAEASVFWLEPDSLKPLAAASKF